MNTLEQLKELDSLYTRMEMADWMASQEPLFLVKITRETWRHLFMEPLCSVLGKPK